MQNLLTIFLNEWKWKALWQQQSKYTLWKRPKPNVGNKMNIAHKCKMLEQIYSNKAGMSIHISHMCLTVCAGMHIYLCSNNSSAWLYCVSKAATRNVSGFESQRQQRPRLDTTADWKDRWMDRWMELRGSCATVGLSALSI